MEFDVWIYPEQLERDMVLNVFRNEGDENIQINEYRLPENWKDIVTWHKGKYGKLSIHDIMIATGKDYKVISEGNGVVIVDKICDICKNNLRLEEYLDNKHFCNECEWRR